MDPRERTNDPLVAIQTALDGRQAQIWTCLPGIIHSFDAAKMTCEAQPTIQAQFRNPQGVWNNMTIPMCTDCPVLFPGGGGFLMTFPLAQGDEVLIVFASRCIDGWHASGQISPQAQIRMHDLSDGFVIPKLYSIPRVAGAISATSAQLRSADGTSFIELAPGGVINLTAPGGVNIKGPLNASGGPGGGEAVITGNITVSGEVTANGIPLSTHTHGGVQSGANSTGPPLP